MAFRGFGTPQVNWAVESNIDAAARALGLDRAAIRLRNLASRGEEIIPGDTPADGLWHETVEKAMEMIGWDTPVPEGRGRGLAVGLKSSATTGLSYSTVRLLADGSVLVYAGTSDMGQGARTIFAQIAANEMGVPLDMVSVIMGDTAVVPYDQQPSASRSTVFMGNAIMRACRHIQDQVRVMAASAEGVPRDQVAVEEGVVPGGGVALVRALQAVQAQDLKGDVRVQAGMGVVAVESQQRAQPAQAEGIPGIVVPAILGNIIWFVFGGVLIGRIIAAEAASATTTAPSWSFSTDGSPAQHVLSVRISRSRCTPPCPRTPSLPSRPSRRPSPPAPTTHSPARSPTRRRSMGC